MFQKRTCLEAKSVLRLAILAYDSVVLVTLLANLFECYQWFSLAFPSVYYGLHLFVNTAKFNIYYLLDTMF